MPEMLGRLGLASLFIIIAVEIPNLQTTVIDFSAADPNVQGLAQLGFIVLSLWSFLGGMT